MSRTPEVINLVPGDIIVTKCHTYGVQSLLGDGCQKDGQHNGGGQSIKERWAVP